MIAWIEITLGLLIGGVGFNHIAENPLPGCCALLIAGFLIMTGFEKRLFRKAAESDVE
ncbi:MAG: hypothetical protein WAW37_13640 [Syntrophobacteraceae bacterium]